MTRKTRFSPLVRKTNFQSSKNDIQKEIKRLEFAEPKIEKRKEDYIKIYISYIQESRTREEFH